MDEDANIRFGAGVVTMKRESGGGAAQEDACAHSCLFLMVFNIHEQEWGSSR